MVRTLVFQLSPCTYKSLLRSWLATCLPSFKLRKSLTLQVFEATLPSFPLTPPSSSLSSCLASRTASSTSSESVCTSLLEAYWSGCARVMGIIGVAKILSLSDHHAGRQGYEAVSTALCKGFNERMASKKLLDPVDLSSAKTPTHQRNSHRLVLVNITTFDPDRRYSWIAI